MNISDILNIAFVAIGIILFLVALFYHGKNKVVTEIASQILDAEVTYGIGTGAVKMAYVVGKLYAMLPAFIRPLLPSALLQTMVQTVFNKIQAFAQLQIRQLAAAKSAEADDASDKAIGTVSDTAGAATGQTGVAEASQVQQVTAGLNGN